MIGSHIIDERHRLRWHQRLFSDASTAAAWGGWLWLWAPFVHAAGRIVELGSKHALQRLVAVTPGEGLEQSVVALVGTSGTLLVLNQLPPAQRVAPVEAPSARELARTFAVAEADLVAARAAPVAVVHHDADGRIVRIERRSAAAPVAGAA